MKKPVQISIPTPCHENWQQMTPVDKGRYCDSCQKNVIDFSRSSDREIAKAISIDQNLCGRFRADQLGRDLFVPKEKNKWWAAASAALLGFISLLSTGVSASTSRHTLEQHEATPDAAKKMHSGKPEKIKGRVKDAGGKALGSARLVNVRTGITTLTDKDGQFEMDALTNDKIQVFCTGHETKEIVFDGKNLKCITLEKIKEDIMILGGLG